MIRRVVFIGFAFVLVIAVFGGFLFFHRPSPGAGVEVEIPTGASTAQIATVLHEQGVIGSTLGFRIASRLRGLDGKIQAGRYELRKNMGVQAALDVLSRPPPEKGVTVTIPEGFTLRQIAARIGARTQISEASFMQAATSGAIRARIQPPDVNTLEGFLYPETYFIGERENAGGVVKRMVDTFDGATAEFDWSYAESHGLSKYQAVILASLVEREAKLDEDRPKVAAVVYNRLAKHMRLQIDITAIYDLPQHKVPTRADLRRRSPYNTYLIDGLPPTPIANPGHESLTAALHPAAINALYYVVCEPNLRECFTDSPQEFERLKARRPEEVH